MAKNKTFCTRYAQVQVNGKNKDSKLHKALLEKISNRPVANLVYAMYLQQGVADAMDNKNYQRNTQGQHSASAVLEHFGFKNIVTDIADSSIRAIEVSKGVRDSNDRLHNFSDPMDAYNIAKEINEMTNAQGDSLHLAATVVRHGNEFQVLVNPISSGTNLRAREVNNAIFLWDSLKNAMGLQGVDMDALRVPFSDILNMGTGMINYIESIAQTDNKYLTPREIQFVLTANRNSSTAQSLVNAFGGDIVATAQAVYDNYHVGANPAYAGLINRAITESKNLFSVLDSNFNSQTIDRIAAETAASPEMGIKDTLKQLNHKYSIDFRELDLDNNTTKSLSEATAKAITILERRIHKLEARRYTSADVKKISKLKDTLLRELETGRYYMGILHYITEADEIINKLETDLQDALNASGTDYEKATKLAAVLNGQNEFVDGHTNLFRDLLKDLTNLDKMQIDENLSQVDIDTIKQRAEAAYTTLRKLQERGEELTQDCFRTILYHFLGDKIDGKTMADVEAMFAQNISRADFLYSFGKLSDPILAAIGTMVRDAQDDRTEELGAYTEKIGEATAKLYDSGSNSEFMYEDDGHILSDYDWKAYQKAWNKARYSLISQGIKGFDLEEAMELWEEANTESIPVDKAPDGTIRRTERVPKLSLYRKAGQSFRDKLTPAQNEYYDTMMQIKGEIGSLLPEYAQRQFLPPQLRRDLFTALSHEKFSSKSAKAALEKFEELWKVKQDDTEWGIMGTKGASYQFARGDLSGKQAQQIPIFFVNKLSNSDELFKNFSAGVQALAATAENYHHMSNIIDVAEFMRTYTGKLSKQIGTEVGGSKTTAIVSKVTGKGGTALAMQILDNMFEKHFYGASMLDNPYFAKAISAIVGYTSFRGLATNTFGAVANLLVGEQQLFQRAVGDTLYRVFHNFKQPVPYFGITDWCLGLTKLFGAVGEAAISTVTGKNVPSVILDLITNNKQSMDYLLAEKFDLLNENYGSMMHTKYHKGFRQLCHNISFILYGAGEKAIRYNTLWAMMHARKVKDGNGKILTLRDAFIKTGYKNYKHLEYKNNIYDLNGGQITDDTGALTKYGKVYMRQFKEDLRGCCQGMFGAMNDEDKGAIHQYALGRAAMNFRQWMVGHYSERFRGVHWDMDKREYVKGYWVSSTQFIRRSLTSEEAADLWEAGHKIRFMGQFMKDLLTFRTKFREEWTKASPIERQDLMRLMSAVITYSLLFGSACWVGGGLVSGAFGGIVPIGGDSEDEKYRKKLMDPSQKFAYYQLKRLLFDAESSTPWGAFRNYETMLNSIIPALKTFDNAFYFITGLGDYGTPLQSGPDAGMDKYWRNILKYNMPFWRDYKRLEQFEENDEMFNVFENPTLK